jgi:hypothetical protein
METKRAIQHNALVVKGKAAGPPDVLRAACLLATSVSAKPALKVTCLFPIDGLFLCKAQKSPNKHPLSVILLFQLCGMAKLPVAQLPDISAPNLRSFPVRHENNNIPTCNLTWLWYAWGSIGYFTWFSNMLEKYWGTVMRPTLVDMDENHLLVGWRSCGAMTPPTRVQILVLTFTHTLGVFSGNLVKIRWIMPGFCYSECD